VIRAQQEKRLLIAFVGSICLIGLLALLPFCIRLLNTEAIKPALTDDSGEYRLFDPFVPPPAPQADPAPKPKPSGASPSFSNLVVRDLDSIPDTPGQQKLSLNGPADDGNKNDSLPGDDTPVTGGWTNAKAEAKEWTYVEEMPVFPGGDAALLRFLQENLRYPADALRKGIEGTVYVGFVINREGKVEKITVRNPIGGGLEEEAIRVVSEMPEWKPGRQNGQTVNVQYGVPVRFRIR
jgi:protein TonB